MSQYYYNDIFRNSIITILIASYRDERTINTILSAMEMANNPDRVRFAIFQQNNANDVDCADFSTICGDKGSNPMHPICSRKKNVKVRRINGRYAKGPLWARAMHDKMIGFDEMWAMQIDCHSVFTYHWDVKVIGMWCETLNDKAIITCYPRSVKESMLSGKNVGKNSYIVAFGCFTFEGKYGMPRIKHAAQITNPLINKPLLVPMFGGGFSFSKAERVRKVKNDPHMPHIFDGEEICLTIRLWTHGYDFYAPTEDIIFHYYKSKDDMKRPCFWETNSMRTERIGKKSSARIRYLLKMRKDDEFEPDLTDINKYYLGNKRNIDDYYRLVKVDPISLKCDNISNYVYNGAFHINYKF